MINARVLVWVWVGLCPMWAWGQTTVPHEFQDGEVIEAREFNDNFEALEAAIDGIPAGPKGDKGDKGDTGATGPSGVSGYEQVVKTGSLFPRRSLNPTPALRAECPAGKVPIGGGWHLPHDGSDSDNSGWVSAVKPHKSQPYTDGSNQGWEVALVSNFDMPLNVDVVVTAICINAL